MSRVLTAVECKRVTSSGCQVTDDVLEPIPHYAPNTDSPAPVWSSVALLRLQGTGADSARVRCSQAQRPQDWMSSPMRPIQSLQLAQRIEAAGPEGLKLEDLKRVAEELGLDERQCIIHQRHLRHKARRQGRLPPAEGPWNPLGASL